MKTTRKSFSGLMSCTLAIAVLSVCGLLLAPSPAQAQSAIVYSVFDADAAVPTCRTTLNGAAAVDVAVVVDNVRGVAAKGFRVCLVDVSAVPDGANVVTAAPYDPIWGVIGASVSFPFTRPTAGGSSGVGPGRLSR